MDEEELYGQGEQSQGLESHIGDLDEHGCRRSLGSSEILTPEW